METLARVWVYARRYPFYAGGTLFCAIATTLLGFVFPQATGLVFDRVLRGGHPEQLLPYCLVVAGAFLLRDILNSLRIQLNNTFEQNVIVDLRRDLYAALQRLPLGWYDQRATGDLMTRVGDDVTSVERVLIDGIEQGVVAVLQIVGVMVILCQKNVRLTLFMLIPIPLMAAAAAWFTSTAHRRYRAQRKAVSAMNSLLLDHLHGIRQIKSYAREGREETRFVEHADAVRTTTLDVMLAWARYSPGMNFLASIGYLIVLFVGGRDVVHGVFTAGELVSFLLFAGMFYEPVGRLHGLNQLFQAARAAGGRVFEILDAEPERYEPAVRAPTLERVRGGVAYEDVGFAYAERAPVLRGVGFEIPAGRSLALVGPSGAGKSTIANLLPRFYEATSGRILIDGQDTRDLDLRTLREKIGVVSQESFLFNATVLDNLRFGNPDATMDEIDAAAKAAHAYDFIAKLPDLYDTHVGERGVKLSVGEKQRISIARALLKDPPILILDEATASVDTATEQLIHEALARLLRGRTSLLIAHRLSTVREADQILVVRNGEIVERGNHDSLLAENGLYARLCRVQEGDLLSERQFEKAFQEAELR